LQGEFKKIFSSAKGSNIIAAEIQLCKKTKLITCFDPIPESRKRCSQKFGCDMEDSVEAVIARDDVDAVFILSSNVNHAETFYFKFLFTFSEYL